MHGLKTLAVWQEEEIMCASDLDLCVGLVFTLVSSGEESRGEIARLLSPAALRGLADLVKHSTRFDTSVYSCLSILHSSTSSSSSIPLPLPLSMLYASTSMLQQPLAVCSIWAYRYVMQCRHTGAAHAVSPYRYVYLYLAALIAIPHACQAGCCVQ